MILFKAIKEANKNMKEKYGKNRIDQNGGNMGTFGTIVSIIFVIGLFGFLAYAQINGIK